MLLSWKSQMEHFLLIPLGKQGLQEKRTKSLKKFRNQNSMLRILDSLISVKRNTEQDANPAIELWHSSQHHLKWGYQVCGQSNIDRSPPWDKLFLKLSLKKTQIRIFTSGTDVKKLWIKNLKVTFHQKLCSSSLSSDLGLCSQTAPTHWFSQDMPWSAKSERSSPRSTKKDEGFCFQNGTSRSVNLFT